MHHRCLFYCNIRNNNWSYHNCYIAGTLPNLISRLAYIVRRTMNIRTLYSTMYICSMYNVYAVQYTRVHRTKYVCIPYNIRVYVVHYICELSNHNSNCPNGSSNITIILITNVLLSCPLWAVATVISPED